MLLIIGLLVEGALGRGWFLALYLSAGLGGNVLSGLRCWLPMLTPRIARACMSFRRIASRPDYNPSSAPPSCSRWRSAGTLLALLKAP